MNTARIAIVMGSQSDWPTLKTTSDILTELQIEHISDIVSAHRTPDKLTHFAKNAQKVGLQVIIAGAGGAAHLPGMIAAHTQLPVLGVPIQSQALNGMDSLLSIVQMPKGIAVGTLAIGTSGAFNAGLLAAQILSLSDDALGQRIQAFRKQQTQTILDNPDPTAGAHS